MDLNADSTPGGSLGDLRSDAEPPTFPPALKRRRTGLNGGSVAHLRVVWQNLESAVAGVQAELAARLAAIERREASLSAREEFYARLEAELAARGALLAQGAAAAAQAAGGEPPADDSAQAARAVRLLQALAADGGLPTEARRQEADCRQHGADAADLQQPQMRGRSASSHQLVPPDGSPSGGVAPGAARSDSFAADSGTLQALGRELRAAGVIGASSFGGRGCDGASAAADAQFHGTGSQPAFSQHSLHSNMSHATAIGNPNDSPDSPRSHLRFPPPAAAPPRSPGPQLRGQQPPQLRLRLPEDETAAQAAPSQGFAGQATPGYQSRNGSPEASAATGAAECGGGGGGGTRPRKALPRSPFEVPPLEAAPQQGSHLLGQLQFPHLVGVLSGDSSTPHFRAAGKTAAGWSAGPPAAASFDIRSIGRIDSTDGSCAQGPARMADHHNGMAAGSFGAGTGGGGNAGGGVRIKNSRSTPRLDLAGLSQLQQRVQQGQRAAAGGLAAGSRPEPQRRHSGGSLQQPLVVGARQPGLDSLANVAVADADGADVQLLPASSAHGRLGRRHPSPQPSGRSRAGSPAVGDAPSDGPAQTLQQAVNGETATAGDFLRSVAGQRPPQGGSAAGAQGSQPQPQLQAATAPKHGTGAGGSTFRTGPHPAVGAGRGECAAEGSGGLPLAFSKTLDYKSCDHILCLTKAMARELLPPAPHSCSAAGTPCSATQDCSSCQMQVALEDPAGRVWPMTYRSVPARYSYEFRAGWKAFAAHWGIATGDAITLSRYTDDRFRLRIEIAHGVGGGATGGAARGAKARGGSKATSHSHSAGAAAAAAGRRNGGGGVAGGPVAAAAGADDGPAAMAPLLAAVQQAAVAEHMLEP